MNEAQAEWKAIWSQRHQWQAPRHWLKQIRREAALERRIAALERENKRLTATLATQAARIEELESDLDEYQIQEYHVVFDSSEA